MRTVRPWPARARPATRDRYPIAGAESSRATTAPSAPASIGATADAAPSTEPGTSERRYTQLSSPPRRGAPAHSARGGTQRIVVPTSGMVWSGTGAPGRGRRDPGRGGRAALAVGRLCDRQVQPAEPPADHLRWDPSKSASAQLRARAGTRR